MQNGCPFKHAKLEDADASNEKACPYLAALKNDSHPAIYSLDESANCQAFKNENGCPFRAESADSIHRLFGLDEEALNTIKSKCPGFSTGSCPFSSTSSAHPTISSASQLSECPAFKEGGCIFDAASSQTCSVHPNVGFLFKNPISACPAFSKQSCPFATLGKEKGPSASSLKEAKNLCPAMQEGCPFADAKTLEDFAKRWSEVPASHLELLSGSDRLFANIMSSIRQV
jgi:hypothetical protein